MAEEKIKIVLIGSANAGKTSLKDRLSNNTFKEDVESTIGASFLGKNLTLASERKVTGEIWDVAGQERYKAMVPMYLHNAAAVGIVLAPNPGIKNREEALKNLTIEATKYYADARKEVGNGVPIHFIINKMDLLQKPDPSEELNLSEDDIKGALSSVAQEKVLFCSAKTGYNVEPVFEALGTAGLAYIEENKKFSPSPKKTTDYYYTTTPLSPSSSGRRRLDIGIWGIGNIVLTIAAIVTIATLASIPTGGISLLAGLTVLGVAGIAIGAAFLLWNLCCFIANQWKKDGGGGAPPPTELPNDDDLYNNWVATPSPSEQPQSQPEKFHEVLNTISPSSNPNETPSTQDQNDNTNQPR